MKRVVSWAKGTACTAAGCSRTSSARNGLQVRVSIGTQCSHQQRQRYSYSTAGTLCYFVAAFQDPPLHFTLNALPQLYSILLSVSLSLLFALCVSASLPHEVILKCEIHVASSPARLPSPEGKGIKGQKTKTARQSNHMGRTFSTLDMRWEGRACIRRYRWLKINQLKIQRVTGCFGKGIIT